MVFFNIVSPWLEKIFWSPFIHTEEHCNMYSDAWPFSHGPSSMLTINNPESPTNITRYIMENQVRNATSRSLTGYSAEGRTGASMSKLEIIAEVVNEEKESKIETSTTMVGNSKELHNGHGEEETACDNDNFDKLPDQTAKSRSSPTISRDKKVTFHPSQVKDSSASECESETGFLTPTDSFCSTSSLGFPHSAPDLTTETTLTSRVHRANSEPKLSEKTDYKPKSKSFDSSTSRDALPSMLVRSSSDRALSTFSPSTLASLDIARKDKKRRSLIKRKILKLQRAFKKKRGPSLEESEEAGDYPPGSDESEEASKGSDSNSYRYFNGRDTSIDGRESPVHGLTRTERPRQLKLNSTQRTESKSSTLPNRSSSSSVDLELSGLNGSNSILRLKPNSTSPAALNTLGETEASDLISESSGAVSPRLTPTHSNFDDRQLISPSMGISYHPHTHTLRIQNDSMGKSPPSTSSSFSKQGSMRKKKRSGSWYNVLSPSYKQKNEDFHKFFKDLPITERLLVDYACALVKDILVQGRLYVSQNYLCFHSNILKWQTAVTVNLVDIDQMTKEKTVKVIPNAIQVLLKDKTKMTFTSFTARDRAYLTVFRLWQNALLDKPMSVNQLWYHIHRNYGEELGGCSSDDDYVRPKNMPRKHQSLGEIDSDLKYEFGTTNKVKKKKKSTNSTQTPPDGDFIEKSGSKSSKSSRHSSQDSPSQMRQDSTGDDKSSHSSQLTPDDVSVGDEVLQLNDEFPSPDVESRRTSEMEVPDIPRQEESDDEEAEFAMQDLAKVSMNRMFETSARDMYRIIFSDGCSFWKDTLVNKGTTNINFGTWQDHETARGQKIRELSYTLRLDNPIGPKTSFVKETQIFYPCTIEGKSYAVDCFAQNFNIPYADYFQTVMRYCIRKVAKNSCELRITSELRYRKSPWGLIKNFIEKNVASGLTENFRKLEYQLQDRVDFEKSQSSSDVGKVRKPSNLRRRKRKSEASGSELQKSENRSSSRLDDGDTRQSSSDLNNNKSGNSSPDIAVGAPSLHTPNGFLPNDQHNYTRSMSVPKLHYFGQGGKFIIGAIFFIFILLIYSNYSMYHRLTTLEHVTAAAATAEGVDPSVTAALLDRPGVPITSNPEILSTYLQAIDKRLRRLEDTVVKYMQDSNSKWEKMEKNWEVLENMLLTIVKKQGADGG